MKSKKGILTHTFCLLIILCIGIFVYRDVIFSSGPSFQVNDVRNIFFPLFYFAKHAFLSGQFPFWDPYQLFGQPIAFNTYPILYPPMLLFLVLPFRELLPRHLELFIVLHMILAGFSVYYSGLRLGFNKWGSLVSSIIFLLAPTVTSFIFNPPAAFMMPWIPLALSLSIVILSSGKPLREERFDFILLVFCLVMIYLAMSPPIFLYIYLTIGLILLFVLLYNLIYIKKLSGIILPIRKFIAIILTPNLLTLFSSLPLGIYLRETARSIPSPQNIGVGPLYFAHIWTLVFPKFAFNMSDSFAYIGILPFVLILFLLPYVGRYIYSKKLALFSFLGSFWFVFAVERSPLYRILAKLPLMSSLRFSHRGLLIYVIFSSLIVGAIVDYLCRLEKGKQNESKIFNLIFQISLPIVLVVSLLISYKWFIGIQKNNPLFPEGTAIGFYLRNFGPAVIGLLLIIFLMKIRKQRFIYNLFWVVPIIAIVTEYSLNYKNIDVQGGRLPPFFPYSEMAEEIKLGFPEVAVDKISLYRVENLGEEPILPYYYKYFSVNGPGYLAQATHPRAYYYLWSKGGGWYGHTYQKPYIDIMRDAINIDSPLYKLMSVKYFIMQEEGSRIIPYEERGKGEYIDISFKNNQSLGGIKITNPKGDLKRRITRLQISIDGKVFGVFDLENISGEQLIKFNPVEVRDLRLTVLDVGLSGFPTSNGIFIEELTFLDDELEDIDNSQIDELNTSSTFWMTDESYLIDRKDTLWESGNVIGIQKKAHEAGLKFVRDGIFESYDTMPRTFLVSNYKVVNEERELLDNIHDTRFDPKKEVVLYKPSNEPIIQKADYYIPAKVDSYRLNSVEISVDNKEPGFLVLTDSFSNGWVAYINGKETDILRAYGIFRAVEVPLSGNNKVVFKYLPPYIGLGTATSFLSLIGIILFFRRV